MNLRFSRTKPGTVSGHVSTRCQARLRSSATLVVELLQTERRPDLVEHAPVQDVELDERLAPGAHLFHARLIERAPRIGQGEPINPVAKRLQDTLGVARNPVPPIDAGAEHIVDERLDAARFRARGRLRHHLRRSETRTRTKRARRRNRRRTLEQASARDIRHRGFPLSTGFALNTTRNLRRPVAMAVPGGSVRNRHSGRQSSPRQRWITSGLGSRLFPLEHDRDAEFGRRQLTTGRDPIPTVGHCSKSASRDTSSQLTRRRTSSETTGRKHRHLPHCML